MWIVRLALRRPYTIAVLCTLVAIFGVLSASRMKTDILPAIDIPVVIVVWSYPGLSAQDIERRVAWEVLAFDHARAQPRLRIDR